MAKWDDRPRTRDRQIGKPEAADNHDPTGLVVAATSAGFAAQSLVPRACRRQRSTDPQDHDHGIGAKASRRTLEIRHSWRCHRAGSNEDRLSIKIKLMYHFNSIL